MAFNMDNNNNFSAVLEVSNLCSSTTLDMIFTHFGQLGQLTDVRISANKNVLVTFSDVESAVAVKEMPSGHCINGNDLFVDFASEYSEEISGGYYSPSLGTNCSESKKFEAGAPAPDRNPHHYVEECEKLFLTSVSQTIGYDELHAYFSQFGSIKDLYLPAADQWSPKASHKGIAFLTFWEANWVNDMVLQRSEYEVVSGCRVIVDKAKTRKDCLAVRANKLAAKKFAQPY